MRETLSYALRIAAIIALAIAAVFTRADVASAHFDGADASQFANDGGKDKADKGGHGDRAKDNDHAKAEETFQACLRQDPNHAECRHALARLWWDTGKRDKAAQEEARPCQREEPGQPARPLHPLRGLGSP